MIDLWRIPTTQFGYTGENASNEPLVILLACTSRRLFLAKSLVAAIFEVRI